MLKINNEKVKLYFDINGSLYMMYNGKTYQVIIDRHNKPCLDPGDYEIYKKVEPEYGSFDIINRESLMSKTAHMEEDNFDDLDFFENAKYEYDENGFSGMEAYETTSSKFYFMCNTNQYQVVDCKNGDILALYETVIYRDVPAFKTKLEGEPFIYRLHVYLDGLITCETSGSVKKYHVVIDKNNLKIISLKTK